MSDIKTVKDIINTVSKSSFVHFGWEMRFLIIDGDMKRQYNDKQFIPSEFLGRRVYGWGYRPVPLTRMVRVCIEISGLPMKEDSFGFERRADLCTCNILRDGPIFEQFDNHMMIDDEEDGESV